MISLSEIKSLLDELEKLRSDFKEVNTRMYNIEYCINHQVHTNHLDLESRLKFFYNFYKEVSFNQLSEELQKMKASYIKDNIAQAAYIESAKQRIKELESENKRYKSIVRTLENARQ